MAVADASEYSMPSGQSNKTPPAVTYWRGEVSTHRLHVPEKVAARPGGQATTLDAPHAP